MGAEYDWQQKSLCNRLGLTHNQSPGAYKTLSFKDWLLFRALLKLSPGEVQATPYMHGWKRQHGKMQLHKRAGQCSLHCGVWI